MKINYKSVLNAYVDETGKNDELDIMVKAFIPSVIDTVIEADKGKLKIKKSFRCCFLFPFIPCFGLAAAPAIAAEHCFAT